MPTENRSSNTEQMVSVPLDLVELTLAHLPSDSAAGFELRELLGQPTSDGFSAGDMAGQGAKAFRDGVTACADLIQERMDAYLSEFGAIDPGTGSIELPRGGDEYVGELQEIIDGIRALPLPQ